MNKLGIISIICCLFLSCGGIETTIFRSEGYGFVKSSNAPTLSICISDKIASISYQGSVKDEFGDGDKNELIFSFFKQELAKDFKSTSIFASIKYDELSVQPATNSKSVEVNDKGTVSFSIPVSGTTITCANSQPDIVLFLENISIVSKLEIGSTTSPDNFSFGAFQQHWGSTGYSALNSSPAGQFGGPVFIPTYPTYYGGPSINSSKDLTFEAKMILWDNNAKTVVSYGFIHVVDSNRFAVSKEDWVSLVKEFSDKILEGTPFTKL